LFGVAPVFRAAVAPVFAVAVAVVFGVAFEVLRVWAYADTEQAEKANAKAMTKIDFITFSPRSATATILAFRYCKFKLD
jgi:hypothetical protein